MARTEAAEKIELPDTLQVGLMHESQKNHAINMGHLAFDLATLRASSMFNVKSMEIAHMHMMQTLDSVAANELLTVGVVLWWPKRNEIKLLPYKFPTEPIEIIPDAPEIKTTKRKSR